VAGSHKGSTSLMSEHILFPFALMFYTTQQQYYCPCTKNSGWQGWCNNTKWVFTPSEGSKPWARINSSVRVTPIWKNFQQTFYWLTWSVPPMETLGEGKTWLYRQKTSNNYSQRSVCYHFKMSVNYEAQLRPWTVKSVWWQD